MSTHKAKAIQAVTRYLVLHGGYIVQRRSPLPGQGDLPHGVRGSTTSTPIPAEIVDEVLKAYSPRSPEVDADVAYLEAVLMATAKQEEQEKDELIRAMIEDKGVAFSHAVRVQIRKYLSDRRS